MRSRYGTGELYGLDFAALTPEAIRHLSQISHTQVECPFKARELGKPARKCHKKGGVCSLRLFEQDAQGEVKGVGEPVITCPSRFLEADLIVQWVGEALLGASSPIVLSELPFLMGNIRAEEETEAEAVGKVDKVLVNANSDGNILKWCALEMQAVYFSGLSMENDFKVMRDWTGPRIPFPTVQRRPDFRSSGPKRLMPQLQVKVPTISRWGKKMAVVIDKAFWKSLGEMRETRDLSNSEIVWFVVSYAPTKDGHFTLCRDEVHYTTLSNAVEGLTGGTPVSLESFEREIHVRLRRS